MGANTVTQYATLASYKTDPLRNFKYHVIINNPLYSNANTAVTGGFMSVSGLGIQTDIIAYRQGGYNTTALPLDAPILTTSGWKANGEIELGDLVIDPRGQDSKVIGIYPAGVKDVYEITLADGSTAISCWGHLWEVVHHEDATEVVSTLKLKKLVETSGVPVLMPKIEPLDLDGDLTPTLYHVPISSVRHIGRREVQCLEVSADSHLFVTYEYMASHNTQKMPGQSDFGPLVLQKGLIPGDQSGIDWIKQIFLVQQGSGNWSNDAEFRSNVDILVVDHPVVTPTAAVKAAFRVYNAWCTQLSFTDLDAAGNGFIVAQLTLAHEGWDLNVAPSAGSNSTVSPPN